MPDVIGIISDVIQVIWPAPHPRCVAAGTCWNPPKIIGSITPEPTIIGSITSEPKTNHGSITSRTTNKNKVQ